MFHKILISGRDAKVRDVPEDWGKQISFSLMGKEISDEALARAEALVERAKAEEYLSVLLGFEVKFDVISHDAC